MIQWLNEFCGVDFMPHGQCYLWTPSLIWLHVIADGLIGLAYFSIPLVLVYFVRKRRDVPYSWLFLLFGAFIVACGTTHWLEIWVVWTPHYYLTGGVKALTALISLFTAGALVKVLPQILQFSSPEELRRLNEELEGRFRERTADLEATNARLKREIAEREKGEGEIGRLNQLLQRRVHELQVLLNVLPVGVGIADDPLCRTLRANRELSRILNLPPQENATPAERDTEGETRFVLLRHGPVRALDELPMHACVRDNRPVLGLEQTIRREDGVTLDVIVNVVPVQDEAGATSGCVVTLQDVTSRREAAAARARLAAIVTSSGEAIIGRRPDGVVTDWNGGAERIFGYTAVEMIGQLLDRLVPPGREGEEALSLARIVQGEVVAPFETARIRRDGTLVDVSVMVSPIHDELGAVVGVSELAHDITDRRRAERERGEMERKLQDTQKLESLGVLAGGIAHDFNNLLTVIMGNVSLAGMGARSPAETAGYLRQIDIAARRAAELSGQMLAYSGRGRFVLSLLNLNEIISDSSKLIEVSVGKACMLQLDLAEPMPRIQADAAQLRQIAMNLATNAAEAIGDRPGVVRIKTGVVRLTPELRQALRHGAEIVPDDCVFLEVSDDGCGMNSATQERIFDPFFTTKFIGRGLGLAAVLGIIRGHRGAIKIDSKSGQGTSIRVYFPMADRVARPSEAAAAQAPEIQGPGCVLVVDDEASVRKVATGMLEALGYTVEEAEDGLAAVERFRAHPDRFRFVLLDLTMPRQGGEETFRQMHLLRPAVRVILMSGYSELDAVGRFTGKGLTGFVQKPFTLEALVGEIRRGGAIQGM
jgi:PAS domain S-box-containing protein